VVSYSPIGRLRSDERGTTAIEYGLICAMIALVVISIAGVGGGLTVTWDKLHAVIAVFGG
jgi:Flp pilus assembly pilin Flp